METWLIVLIIVISVIVLCLVTGIIIMLCITLPIAERLYQSQWVRHSKEQFARGCSDATFDYHLDMFNQGMENREQLKQYINEVKISNLGIDLYGEYYDFGNKKAIIMLPGRTETCLYGSYYVPAFKEGGYNVLCIDPRSHGLSGGEKLTLGNLEALDAIAWAKYLHEFKGVDKICLYGLCGGATASCLVFKNKNCPSYIDTFIADGMFYSFYRVYKRHIIEEKKPVYPVILEVMHKIKVKNKTNPYKATPHVYIKEISPSILILSGDKDIFSLSSEAEAMYKSCPSIDKQFVIIKNGRHSHLRYDNKKDYDEAVISFLKKH